MNNQRFVQIYLTLLIALACLTFRPSPTYAHGGVIIDSGYTEQYEWLAAINPYPTTLGPTTITLLVYDIKTHQPQNGLQAELTLLPPDNPSAPARPIALTTDPALYPGDYSTTLALDRVGSWMGEFQLEAAEGTTAITVTFSVIASEGNPASPLSAPLDADATATVFAQNVDAARQTEPLIVPAQSPAFGWLRQNRWIMGVALGLPVVALFVWALRAKTEEEA